MITHTAIMHGLLVAVLRPTYAITNGPRRYDDDAGTDCAAWVCNWLQLINMKQNQGKGYDATKADVWACGVLLFVMLLGMFPFEHT